MRPAPNPQSSPRWRRREVPLPARVWLSSRPSSSPGSRFYADASLAGVSPSGKSGGAPDEAQAAGDPRVDAGAAQAAGEGSRADRPDQARPAEGVCDQRAAAVPLAGSGVEGEPAVDPPDPLAECTDHRASLE